MVTLPSAETVEDDIDWGGLLDGNFAFEDDVERGLIRGILLLVDGSGDLGHPKFDDVVVLDEEG